MGKDGKGLNTKVVRLDDSFDLARGRPNSGQGARDMAPEIPAAQTSPKPDRLSSEVILGILSSFLRKPMNTKG
jgi:hypothetical protein